MGFGIFLLVLGLFGIYAYGFGKDLNFNSKRGRALNTVFGATGARIFVSFFSIIFVLVGLGFLYRHFIPAKQPISIDGKTEGQLIDTASSLMVAHKYRESSELYTRLSAKYPTHNSFYMTQIGNNYYLLGNFDKAIEYYVKGRDNGEDSTKADDNIWEASQAEYKKSDSKSLLQKYLQLCPNGTHAKEAQKLLTQ